MFTTANPAPRRPNSLVWAIRDGGKQCIDAGVPLDIVTTSPSSLLFGVKAVMSTPIDPMPARLRHLPHTTASHRVSAAQSHAPRHAHPRTLPPEDSVPKPSCAPAPLSCRLPSAPLRSSHSPYSREAADEWLNRYLRQPIAPRLRQHPPWLLRNRTVMRKRALQSRIFQGWTQRFRFHRAPPTGGTLQTQTEGPTGDQRISRSDKMDKKEGSRTISLPSMTPTAPSVSFRTRPRRLCIPRPRLSHRAHRFPIEPTAVPSRTPAHASLPQRPHARIRLPSGHVPTTHLIFDPTLVLFAATRLSILAYQGVLLRQGQRRAAFSRFHPSVCLLRGK